MRRVRLEIRGLVQGVAYRASAAAAGRRLGSVVAEVQGPADAVDAMVDWCKDGPPSARVDGVQVIDRPAVDGESAFTIQR